MKVLSSYQYHEALVLWWDEVTLKFVEKIWILARSTSCSYMAVVWEAFHAFIINGPITWGVLEWVNRPEGLAVLSRANSDTLVKQKYQSVMWSFCSRNAIGTAKLIDSRETCGNFLKLLAHVPQQIWGAQGLSWFPTLQPKYKFYAFLTKGLILCIWAFTVNSPHTYQGCSHIFDTLWDQLQQILAFKLTQTMNKERLPQPLHLSKWVRKHGGKIIVERWQHR